MPLTDRILTQYSEYLTFRSIVTGFPLTRPDPALDAVVSNPVADEDEAIERIKEVLAPLPPVALLLSSGMDSAILAPFLPKGSVAYTLYHPRIERTEIELAAQYCDTLELKHVTVPIEPSEYLGCADELMIRKGMPLSPAEPVFYLAARAAVQDGFDKIVTGNAGDTWHGGFAHFRQKLKPKTLLGLWHKYYINAATVLNHPQPVEAVFEDFMIPSDNGPVVDGDWFLREIGTERFAHDNAIHHAGAEHIKPLRNFLYEFDAAWNRKHQKYFIRRIYKKIYGSEAPKKAGMQKPYFVLGSYQPANPELFCDFNIKDLDFDRRALVCFLERFEALRQAGEVRLP